MSVSVDAQRFSTLVQEAAGIDDGHAARVIAATLATRREAVGDEEFLDVMPELPADDQRTLMPAGGRSG